MTRSQRRGEPRPDPREAAYRFIRVCSQSLATAALMLDEDPSLLNAGTGIGETPLHYLAVENALEWVRWLVTRGAVVDP